jgi:hypothetical protein
MFGTHRESIVQCVVLCGMAVAVVPAWAQCVPKWVQMTPFNEPPAARHAPAMAYDAAAGVVVMYGGSPSASAGVSALGDTWTWNGLGWSQVSASSPTVPPLRNAAMAFSTALNRVVLHGGIDNTGAVRGNAYSFDVATGQWTALPSLNTVLGGSRFNHTLTNTGSTMVVAGGQVVNCSSSIFGRLIRMPAAWFLPPFGLGESYGVQTHGTFYRTASDSLFMVGGVRITSTCDTASENATQNVVQISGINTQDQSSTATTAPFAARNNLGLADNFERDEVVVFGGANLDNFPSGSGLLGDTWVRRSNGAWSALPIVGPSPRRAFNAMTYDAARNQFVLFGGHDGAALRDSWVLTYGPVVTQHPRLLNVVVVNPGDTVQLEAQADGPGTLQYSWQRNGVAISNGPNGSGSIFSGQGTNVLTIANVTAFEDAEYTVVVSNSCGSVTSLEVRLPVCYANCDGSTGFPVLNPADFTCFLNRYRAGDAYANCDGSAGTPALTPADFTCFLAKYRAGCF